MYKLLLTTAAVAAAICLAFAGEPSGKPSNANLAKFIPAGYRFIEEVRGDLNGDGADDYVLIIKATDKKKVVRRYDDDPKSDIVDLNRRGVMIFFSDGNDYRLVQEHRRCFESEEEYPSPTATISVRKGNLYVEYCGRLDDTHYTFRYRNSEMELVGYDDGCDGCDVDHNHSRSINFLTKKQLWKGCVNIEDDKCMKIEETWSNIIIKKTMTLRDFCSDTFNIDSCYIGKKYTQD